MRKAIIFWGVLALLLLAGGAAAWCRLLPVNSSLIFLLGLYWFWTGLSRVIRVNPFDDPRYTRGEDAALSLLVMGMGLAWCGIALTPYVQRGLPVLAVSVPFLAPAFVLFLRCRRR